MRVLLSDLLWPSDPLAALSRLAERATAVILVQVLAEVDVNPIERGNIRLVDSETDEVQEIFLDTVAEKRYRAAFAHHQEELESRGKTHRSSYDDSHRRAHPERLAIRTAGCSRGSEHRMTPSLSPRITTVKPTMSRNRGMFPKFH